MLLSDAFVPISEETGENSTELKVFVLSSPHKDEQITLSPTKSEESPLKFQVMYAILRIILMPFITMVLNGYVLRSV